MLGALACDSLQPVAVFRGLDFLRIFPADRGQVVGKNQRAFQEVDFAVELHGIHVEQRSEEHTSELQSLRHLVCRLLLEKKKKKAHLPTLLANTERVHTMD